MDTLKKNLVDRKKVREDLLTSLDAMYTECGAAQFEYATHNAQYLSHSAAVDFELWKNLRASRIQNADMILDIKTAHSRQHELKVFYDEVDKLSYEQKCSLEKVRNAFVLMFFQIYAEDALPCLQPIIQDIAPLNEDINVLLKEQHKLEEEKHTAHFFKKLALSPQVMALKNKVNSLQKKINNRIIAAADTILSDSVLAEVRARKPFPESLEPLYADFLAGTAKQHEIENRKQTLILEQKKLNEQLIEYGVSDTPHKRITALNNQIKNIDAELLEVEMRQGIRYADVFYTAEGVVKKDDIVNSEPDLFKPYLDSIAEYRIKIEENKFNIEYIENEIALASEVRKIEALKKAIVGYKDGITQYEQLITTAESDIVRAEMLKAHLEEKNKELLPKFSSALAASQQVVLQG